ncbi:MAG: Ig-like domain-containing protein, partial [Rikenellaceae bacterium]
MKTKNFTLAALLLVAILSGCSKDEDQTIQVSTKSPMVLNYEETANIDAVSTQPISYNSENEFHAKVSNSGEITAQHVGEAKINLTNGSDSKSIQVVVEPKFNL